jgi:hypothetical protein
VHAEQNAGEKKIQTKPEIRGKNKNKNSYSQFFLPS